jgi:uncharacterized protein (TIGR02996 family)
VNEEAGFIDALGRDPADDVTRAVYADWLEEGGDGRAAFLRAEIALSQRPDGGEAWCDAAAAVPWAGIDEAWAKTVGPRYDVWLMGYEPTQKAVCIGVIRTLRWCSLAAAKALSEDLPARVVESLPSSYARRAALQLRQAAEYELSVEVRRAGSAAPVLTLRPPVVVPGRPPLAPSQSLFSLWLVDYPLGNKLWVIKTLRENNPMELAEAKAAVEQPLPVCLHGGLWREQAEALARRYSRWATVEVRWGGVNLTGVEGRP